MKTSFAAVLLLLIAFQSYGQITFEKGYFIDNNNQRVECLIKNSDWKNNPDEFEYKITTGATPEKGTLNTVKEFGVTGFSRYVRAETKIDISAASFDHLTSDRNPEWLQQKMFLKILADGRAKLYYYEKSGLIRFFYSLSDTTINQLIYKEYLIADNQVAENFKFREQLWNDVRLANAGMNSVETIRYNASELIRYFNKHNAVEAPLSLAYGTKEKKDSFHLKLSPGINYSNLAVTNKSNEAYNSDFGNQVSVRIGLEGELVLPFNKNKWGLLFEPTFQYFHSEKELSTSKLTIRLNTIELPIGLRYYIFLNHKVNLFANAFCIPGYSINLNSKFTKDITISSVLPEDMKLESTLTYAFGGGVGYKKYSAELRYYSNREFLKNYVSWDSEYTRISLILGFRFL
jgi:hypothetical protein